MKIAVLISGRGSNLLALLQNQTNYTVSAIFSNKASAPGLAYAKDYNIPSFIFDRKDYSDLQSAKDNMLKKLIELNPDLIVLAGFMQIISPEMIQAFERRIINIHPSLLPEYPGLDTHQKALDDKKKIHGCTVHLVDNGVDTGETIEQASINIEGIKTADDIAAKLLPIEHKLFPWVVQNIANKNIILSPSVTKNCEFKYET